MIDSYLKQIVLAAITSEHPKCKNCNENLAWMDAELCAECLNEVVDSTDFEE